MPISARTYRRIRADKGGHYRSPVQGMGELTPRHGAGVNDSFAIDGMIAARAITNYILLAPTPRRALRRILHIATKAFGQRCVADLASVYSEIGPENLPRQVREEALSAIRAYVTVGAIDQIRKELEGRDQYVGRLKEELDRLEAEHRLSAAQAGDDGDG